jgi:hypothetical protein
MLYAFEVGPQRRNCFRSLFFVNTFVYFALILTLCPVYSHFLTLGLKEYGFDLKNNFALFLQHMPTTLLQTIHSGGWLSTRVWMAIHPGG